MPISSFPKNNLFLQAESKSAVQNNFIVLLRPGPFTKADIFLIYQATPYKQAEPRQPPQLYHAGYPIFY
jgi:hypothetical protein